MSKRSLVASLAVITLLAGCGTAATLKSNANIDTTTVYTATDVAAHNKSADCWLIIDQKVYDVTSYIPNHPGGQQLLAGCGVDATGLFTGTTGMGRMHSAAAKAMLANYQIGKL